MRRYLTAALAAAALLPVVPAHAGALTSTCVTVVDPKGDTAPLPDPSLDLTGFTLRTVGARLIATVSVAQASTRPTFAPDSRTEVTFTVGDKRVILFAKNSLQRTQEANAFYQQGIRVNDVFITGDVDASFAGNTLTIKVKTSVLRNALASPVQGKIFTAISAATRANYLYQDANVTFDTAEATKPHFLGGVTCQG